MNTYIICLSFLSLIWCQSSITNPCQIYTDCLTCNSQSNYYLTCYWCYDYCTQSCYGPTSDCPSTQVPMYTIVCFAILLPMAITVYSFLIYKYGFKYSENITWPLAAILMNSATGICIAIMVSTSGLNTFPNAFQVSSSVALSVIYFILTIFAFYIMIKNNEDMFPICRNMFWFNVVTCIPVYAGIGVFYNNPNLSTLQVFVNIVYIETYCTAPILFCCLVYAIKVIGVAKRDENEFY